MFCHIFFLRFLEFLYTYDTADFLYSVGTNVLSDSNNFCHSNFEPRCHSVLSTVYMLCLGVNFARMHRHPPRAQ